MNSREVRHRTEIRWICESYPSDAGIGTFRLAFASALAGSSWLIGVRSLVRSCSRRILKVAKMRFTQS